MANRRTSKYLLQYFEDGDVYSAKADMQRFQTVENQLDLALKLSGGGVLSGWGLLQTSDQSGTTAITINPGFGIVPFTLTKIDQITGVATKEQHFIGVRTNAPIIIPNLGLNRISVIYIEINNQLIQNLQNNPEAIIDLSEEAILIIVRPSINSPAGSGPYRTTTSTNEAGLEKDISTGQSFDEYPIYFKKIDGLTFIPDNNKAVVFINDKKLFRRYFTTGSQGNVIGFNDPLHQEDNVIVRVDPLNSLVIGEVRTDNTKVIDINNEAKEFAREKSADSLVGPATQSHVHDGQEGNPSKILLTTKTDFISPSSTSEDRIFTFNKPDESVYGHNFANGTYETFVYINGFFSFNSASVLDNGSTITVTFQQSLEPIDVVQIVLVLNNDQTQIKSTLNLSGNNPSEEKVDINISGDSIKLDQIDPILIPAISHIGRHKEAMRPGNDPFSSREYVHRSENFDYQEFYPVHKNKFNARNAKHIFFDEKNSSLKLIHACASNDFLYMETDKLMFQLPENFIGGWSSITLNKDINEYDSPFIIIPVKNPINITSDNWDRLFYVGNRFINQNDWQDLNNPDLDEIVNLSFDLNTTPNTANRTNINGIRIQDACGGESPLLMDKTAFMLLDNRVYVYDYISNLSKYFWLDITSTPLWNEAVSLSCIEVEENTILFVGTSDGKIYCNILASSEINNRIDSGANFVPNGNIDFKPFNIWENNSYSYGYGYSQAIDFFDVFGVRGNVFGYGTSGYGFGNEEKLPIKVDNNLLFVTANVSEKNTVATVSDTSLSLVNNLLNTFVGKTSGLPNSFVLLDWFEIANGLSGEIRKVIFSNDRLVVTSDSDVYYSDEVGDKTNLYFKEDYTWTNAFAPSDTHNDINSTSNDILILASDNSIYRGVWNGLFYSWSVSENTIYGISINNILHPSSTIIVDENDIYSCGKYGIFKSVDEGLSWRSTTQIIGLPEDRNSVFTTEKIELRVLDTDPSLGRIIVSKSEFPYGYGYGYGYGEGLDFFDVFGIESTTYGYGVGDFESTYSNQYGYGYGLEISDILGFINDNDWIFFGDNSGSIYRNIPLRVLGHGVDVSGLFYLDVELADASKADFSEIIENQIFSIFRKKEPLAIINGIPQDRRYDSTDIEEYEADYFRQSVVFDNEINPDDEITIASEYKAYEPIFKSIIGLSIDDIRVNGLTVAVLPRDIDADNFIVISDSANIDDIVRITIKNLYITDVGSFSHEEIEDKLSIEELGLPYKLEGIRTSNLLISIMAMQHMFPNTTDLDSDTEINGTATSTARDYIDDSSKTFAPGSLIGRRIILDSEDKEFDYTIENNTASRIWILRKRTYDNFSENANGTESSFLLRTPAILNDFRAYLDGEEQALTADYTLESTLEGITTIVFTMPPVTGSHVIVAYVAVEDDLDFRDFINVGELYEILPIKTSPFSDLINTFVTMYEDESSIDVEFSFIENIILISNDDIGKKTDLTSYIYFNPVDEFIYAGTNKGIWKREKDVSVFCKTSELLPTIDATGSFNPPDTLNGLYVQYNKTTNEWTLTWGLGTNQRDINDNLDDINITAIAHNPADTDMILAGSQDCLYRTIDGGLNWNIVWDFRTDDRIKEFPVPRQIVFDDKNPWIVNVVNQSGLFRSFDYGNNFETISTYDIATRKLDASRSFSYQVDDSDIRGLYYYGENKLKIKNYKSISSFGADNSTVIETGDKNILGISLADLVIRKIENNTSNVNEVFLASEGYGVLKSTVMGNDPQVSRYDFKKQYFNFTDELIDQFNNPNNLNFINNTGAWHFLPDPDRPGETVGRYVIFIDNIRGRTYILTKIENGRRVPTHGEFIGKFITLEANTGFYTFKVIGHYNRGLLPSRTNAIYPNGKEISSQIVEFVLDGRYPFLYNSNLLPLIEDPPGSGNFRRKREGDFKYYWYGLDAPFSTHPALFPVIVQFGSQVPLFAPSNGSINRALVSNGNLFEKNFSGLITFASYRRSETLSPTSSSGNISYTFIKPSVDLFEYSYLFVNGTYRAEVVVNGKSTSNPNTITDTGSTIIVDFDVALSSGDTVGLVLFVINANTQNEEIMIEIHYPTFGGFGDAPPSYFLVVDGLKDFYFGDIQAEEKYKIISSRIKTLTPEEIPLFYAKIYLKLDPESFRDDDLDDLVRLWNIDAQNTPPTPSGRISHAAIFHSMIISSFVSNAITFNQGNLPTILSDGYDLRGYVLYPRLDSSAFFKILSNTEDTIVLDSNNILEIARIGDQSRVGMDIQSGRVLDITIDRNNPKIIYASAKDNPYISLDSGRTWRLINDGLPINSSINESFVKFEKIKIHNSYLYGCALNFAENLGGGIYRFDGNSWEQIGGIDGDDLIPKSVNDFAIFDDLGDTIIYAGTLQDGIYKGNDTLGSFVWEKQKLPDHIINSMDLVKKDNGDLERVWIGTAGKGLFRKDGLSDKTWEIEYDNILKNSEIKSVLWRPWNIFEKNSDIFVDSLFSTITTINTGFNLIETKKYVQVNYGPAESLGLENDPDLFDWEKIGEKKDDKEIPHVFSIDQSNASHITESIDRTITDHDLPDNRRLTAFVSGIKGSGALSENFGNGALLAGIGVPSNSLGIERVNIDSNQPTIYEEPFSHLPDRQSITTIEESDSGRIFFGTDRSGVWRTKSSNGRKYLLPFVENPSDSFDLSNYGYDYIVGRLERFLATSVSDFPNQNTFNRITGIDPTGEIGFIDTSSLFDGIGYSERFFRAENIYTYTVKSSESPDLFSDITLHGSDIIGGYFVLSEITNEARGVVGSNRIILEIINLKSESGDYKLFLSAGQRQAILPPQVISDAIWIAIDKEIESPSGNYNKIVIMDFEKYEDISGNLPKTDIKNSLGVKESAVFIRDMKVIGSEAVIGCGIGGLFVSKDINNLNTSDIEWFNILVPSEIKDITSIVCIPKTPTSGYGYGYGEGLDYFDVFGLDGSLYGYGLGLFEYDYSYGYGYGVGIEYESLDIYVGTWGNGVWAHKGGHWIGDIFTGGTWEEVDELNLKHKNIWKLFLSSNGLLYAGTEHGGIYVIDPNGGSWIREIDNITRSKLFIWKTEGYSTKNESVSVFTNKDNILTYSFGGGVMRSLDEGNSWEQAINGLSNIYVQDLTICPNSTSDTAYVATAGGGVYKTTNAFTGNCSWIKLPTNGLPENLNIDEIEVGNDPNIVYIKTRINDLSFKSLPLSIKNVASVSDPPIFEFGDWTGSLNTSLFNGTRFTPLQPYTKGDRKAIIFRSTDGGNTWESVYDKDPKFTDRDYRFSSSVFGLTLRPGQNDIVHFLYKSTLTSNNPSVGNIDSFFFVTMNGDQIISETIFPLDSYQNLKILNQRTDAYISVNPMNFDEIYISLHGNVGSTFQLPPIYKSTDGGKTWFYSNGHFTSSESFNTKLQISNKIPPSVSAVVSDVSSSISLIGNTENIDKNTAIFENTKIFFSSNFNRIITSSFTQTTTEDPFTDSLFFTYRDEPVVGEINSYPRSFYLTGATIQPNINQPTIIAIQNGGHGDFLPKLTKGVGNSNNPQFVTVVLDQTFSGAILDPISNKCKIGNLTSIKIDYSSLPTESIFRKENSLIGLDISIGGIATKIAIHRALYPVVSSTIPNKIELIVIGDFGSSIAIGTVMSVTLKQPIYSNYDNDLMLSVNSGVSWKKIGKESFSLALDNIKGIANNTVLPTTVPLTVRSTYLLQDEGENSVVYRGDARDERYENQSIERLIWTKIVIDSTFKSNKTLFNGLAFSESRSAIYISESNKISKISISPSISVTTLFDNLNISHPLVVSEANSNDMLFVANSSVYSSKDGFETFQVFTLPQAITPASIKRIVLSRNPDIPDEVFLCVDAGQSFEQSTFNSSGVISEGTTNIIRFALSVGQKNPFENFIKRYISFEVNGSNSIFNTRIERITSSEIYTLSTIVGSVISFSYDTITNKTSLTGNGSPLDAGAYAGNIVTIQTSLNVDALTIFTSRVEDVENITESTFDIIVNGDLRQTFEDNDIDFNTKFPSLRIGKLGDFLTVDYSGKITASRSTNQTLQNGLWYSNTFGEGFVKIDGLEIGGIDDRPGCLDAYLFDNGRVSAILNNDDTIRILTNNNRLPSGNINKVFTTPDGNIFALTSNGLCVIEGDEELEFSSFFYNNFTNIMDLGADQRYIFDAENKTFILSGIPNEFYGDETPTLASFNFNNVVATLKDSKETIWVGTEGFGLYAVFGNNIYNFNADNSNIGSNTIRSVIEDNRGNIWVASGNGGVSTSFYGDNINEIPAIVWTNFPTGIGFTENTGLTGAVNSINVRNTMSIIADGTVDVPQVNIDWTNISSVFPKSIILRSNSTITPSVVNGTDITFVPIRDIVLTIEEETNNGNLVWRITGSTAIDYGTNNLIGKHIVPDTRSNTNGFEIIFNSFNSFDIQRVEDENPPSIGNFMIVEKIDSAFVVYAGDGTDIGFNFSDVDLPNNNQYTYFLFFYNDVNFIYKLTDRKTVELSDSEIDSQNELDMICGGSGGLFKFTPSEDTQFTFIASFGEGNDITNIFFDTSNIGWLAATSKLVEFNSPNIITEFGINDLFSGKTDSIPSSMIVRNAAERSNGDIVIATDVGLSIRDIAEFTSIIENDPDISFRDDSGNLTLNDWRPSTLLSAGSDQFSFIDVGENNALLAVRKNIFSTSSGGNNWSITNNNDDNVIFDTIKFAHKIEKDNEIIDILFFTDRSIYSSGSDNIDILETENLPSRSGILESYSIGDMWLSEGPSSSRLIIGMYNNNIVEEERELAIIDFSSPDEFTTPVTFISGKDGLSIQSAYSFAEINDGLDIIICSGCKDSIIFKKNSDSWKPFITGEIEPETFVYTSLSARVDEESIEHGKTLYATRTPIYGVDFAPQVLSFRIDAPLVDNKVFKYDVNGSLAGRVRDGFRIYPSPIIKVDRPAIGEYNPQWFQKNIYRGHIGAVKFIESSRSLVLGGFANTLMVIPFTAERSDDFRKLACGVYSGLRGHRNFIPNQAAYSSTEYVGFYLPYEINEDSIFASGVFSFSSGLNNKTESNFLTKNKNAWSVKFNEEDGFASYLHFGQNNFNDNKKFKFNSTDNISYLMKTRDGGQIWYSSINNVTGESEFPVASVGDWIFNKLDQDNIIISTVNGLYESGEYNSGIFVTFDGGHGWSNVTDVLPKVPAKSIELIEDKVYAGMLGYGVFNTSLASINSLVPDWEQFESRYTTLNGINIGLWNVTSIEEDRINPERLLIGTTNQGVVQSLNSGESWSFDDNGIPSGNITVIKMLAVNPFVTLVGIKNDGLYIKNNDIQKYEKKTNGLPTNSNIRDIKIDITFSDIYLEFNYSNSLNDFILIIRADFLPPSRTPENGVLYQVGGEIENANVVYFGNEDFSLNKFVDRNGKIRDGIPYYYRFFTLNLDGTYTERDIILGKSTLVESLKITDTSSARLADPFPTSGNGLKHRIVKPSTLTTQSKPMEIVSNTGTELFLRADPFEILNRGGDATFGNSILRNQQYRIDSTLIVIPIKINPIYIIAEDISNGISKVYYSNNNGESWFERNSGITSTDIRTLTLEILNIESRLLLEQAAIYISTADGVFKSEDNGLSWNEISSSSGTNILPNSIPYRKVVVDLEDCNIVYALNDNGETFRSLNEGDSWELMNSFDGEFNVADIVSFFTNHIYVGTNGDGIIRLENSVRDRIDLNVIADGNISFFDIDFIEIGDFASTDTNSITASTLVKNDSISNNREQIRFKTKEYANNIQILIKNNDIPFNVEDVFIGDQLANPPSNPFILRIPETEDDPTIVNQIISLSDNNLYAATNRGAFFTSDFGLKWNKINNPELPDEILDIADIRNNELALATASGLWTSTNDRKDFGIIESSGKRINTIFESSDRIVRNLIRGGENGLRITIENSKSIIAFSGKNRQIKLSWGDIFNRVDGGWSENTQIILADPIFRPIKPDDNSLTSFDGWDHALIVRKGPFTTFEKALAAGINNNIFAPQTQVVYPTNTLVSVYNTPISIAQFFASSNSIKESLEEIRDVNLKGKNLVGVPFSPQRFMTDGSIIVGVLPNRKRSVAGYPDEFDFGPSPEYPIIDSVQPITQDRTLPNNIADLDAGVVAPIIKDDMFYLYRIYPYVLVPEPFAITPDEEFPKLPNYRPSTGDLPDSYSYNLDPDDFQGGISTVFSGITIDGNNWIIGTDNGIFYSTQAGRDPVPTDSQGIAGSGFKIPALIQTSTNIVLAAIVSNQAVYLAKSVEIPLGKNWEIITPTINKFSAADVKRIFNITEDANGFIYVTTNAGIFKGDANGDNWVLSGSVGDLEALSGNRVIGQEFLVI